MAIASRRSATAPSGSRFSSRQMPRVLKAYITPNAEPTARGLQRLVGHRQAVGVAPPQHQAGRLGAEQARALLGRRLGRQQRQRLVVGLKRDLALALRPAGLAQA